MNLVRRKLADLRTSLENASGRKKSELTLAIEEVEAQEDALSNASSSFADPGPMYDCISFFDGNDYRAIVDTTETGVLDSCTVMEDYRLHCRYSTMYDLCNYTVNIWDEGKTLSICVDSGSHGTHVAGMVSAFYPDASHMNGTAPHSRIVSLKIGDTRLDAMETHTGLNRAMAYLLAHSKRPADEKTAADDGIIVDLVNMSFGEATRNPDHGRFIGLANKLVRERNVLFFCSAGNNGPALTSVGAPGGTSDALVGVGAYFTPTMLTEGYSVIQKDVEQSLSGAQEASNVEMDFGAPSESRRSGAAVAAPSSTTIATTAGGSGSSSTQTPSAVSRAPVCGIPYTWTSRGPSPDGSLGVSVCAPGGAIAAIPQWNLSKKRLMNGTSMASPAACSSCAVLVSYLKKYGIPYTSDRVRLAIENSARPLRTEHLVCTYSEAYLAGQSGDQHRMASTTEQVGPGGTAALGHAEDSRLSAPKYTSDLVFAGGCGSIDVQGACSLLERVAQSSERANQRRDVAQKEFDGPASSSLTLEQRTYSSRDFEDPARPPLEWRYRVSVETTAHMAARKNVGSLAGGGSLGATRGIYLRSKAETASLQRVMVRIDALRDDEDLLPSNKAARAAMETTIILEATESWVTTPASVLLHGGGRGFPVIVDPTGLDVGKVHFCEVNGFVFTGDDFRYRVFRLPVTVIVPESPLPGSTTVSRIENVSMSPGAVLRRFYDPPTCCSYAILRITAAGTTGAALEAPEKVGGSPTRGRFGGFEDDSISEMTSATSTDQDPQLVSDSRGKQPPYTTGDVACKTKPIKESCATVSEIPLALSSDCRLLDIHSVQITPRLPTKHTETKQALALVPGAAKEVLLPVVGGFTIEVAVGHRWSSMGISHIRSLEVIFCGLRPQPSALHVPVGAGSFPSLSISNALPFTPSAPSVADGSLNANPHVISAFVPKATLSSVRRPMSPHFSHIRPLAYIRDSLPEETHVSELLLEYKFEVPCKTCVVTVMFPGLNGHVYESAIEGGPYVTILDCNKKLLVCSDIYPERVSLNKGTYHVRASLRHDSVSLLDKLRELPAVISYKLSSSMSLEVYDTSHGAYLQGATDSQMQGSKSKDWKGLIEPGEALSVFFATPKKSALPSWVKLGDVLFGEFSVDDPVLAASSDGNRHRIPKYVLSMAVPVGSSTGGKSLVSCKPLISSSVESKAVEKKVDSSVTETSIVASTGSGHSGQNQENEVKDDAAVAFGKTVREWKIKALASMVKDGMWKEFDRFAEGPGDPLDRDFDFLLLKLQRLDSEFLSHVQDGPVAGLEGEPARLAMIQAADDLLHLLDESDIAAHFGMNVADSDEEARKVHDDFESKRATLVAALFRRARGILCAAPDKTCEEELEDAFKRLERWQKMDGKASLVSDKKNKFGEPGSKAAITPECIVVLATWRHLLAKRFALALRVLNTVFPFSSAETPSSRTLADLRVSLVEKLGWTHIVSRVRNEILLDYPQGIEII